MDNSVRERIKRNTISSSSPPSNFERKPVRSSTFNPPISDFQPSSPSSSSPEHSSEENSPGSSPTGSPKKIAAFLDVPKSDSPKVQKKGALSPAMTGQQTIKVANVCVDLGKFQEALEIYNSKLEQDPSNLTLLNNKGIALDQLGQLKEAVENFNKVLEVNPNDSQTLFNASYALRKLGRIKEAIDCYDRVLEINPNNTEALNNKGLVLDQLGKFKQAIHYYELAISINPNHHIAIYNKGYALRMMGKFDEALEQYDKALDIDPAFADCWSNRALVLYNLRRIRLAIESYDKALQYNSKLYAAQHNKKICVKLLAESMEGKKCLYCRKAFGLLRKVIIFFPTFSLALISNLNLFRVLFVPIV